LLGCLRLHCSVRLSLLLFYSSAPPQDLPSFPTRRSSDLSGSASTDPPGGEPAALLPLGAAACPALTGAGAARAARERGGRREKRSEEHTSELQSRGHLVCRLLLEKKKVVE